MSAMVDHARWADAIVAAALIAVDPVGLRGACVRAPFGPVVDAWLAVLQTYQSDKRRPRRIPSHISDERLLGGLDLSATLRAGRPIAQSGVLAEANGGMVMLPMAERISRSTLAHITAALDTGEIVMERNGISARTPAFFGVIALDEGIEEEAVAPTLIDRLPFLLDLSQLRVPDSGLDEIDLQSVRDASARLPRVQAGDEILDALCAVSLRLGIVSLRAPMMALSAARAFAALDGKDVVSNEHATTAARLVLAPRAVVLPDMETEEKSSPEDDSSEEKDSEQNAQDDSSAQSDGESIAMDTPTDLVLAATIAAIPPGLLQRLKSDGAHSSRARSDGRAGALRQSLLRGRPAGFRRGDPSAGVRLNVIETLRAAAPWQKVRQAGSVEKKRIQIRREDFHITRYKQRTQTTTIFLVDASGSAALNRLAEAKGAVELLLAECYVRRDQVAVLAFRGNGAELLLPPTRSLVRAKRNLAGLPGGGGTPLAAAIDAGVALADQIRRSGQTATLVMLTDGRANVARDGTGNRQRAEDEAQMAARSARNASITTLFIDISPRSQPQARQLAAEMGASYLPLPFADSGALVTAVKQATQSPRR